MAETEVRSPAVCQSRRLTSYSKHWYQYSDWGGHGDSWSRGPNWYNSDYTDFYGFGIGYSNESLVGDNFEGESGWEDHWRYHYHYHEEWYDGDGNLQTRDYNDSASDDHGDSTSWQDPADRVNFITPRLAPGSFWLIAESLGQSLLGEVSYEFAMLVAEGEALVSSPGVYLESIVLPALEGGFERAIDAGAGVIDGALDTLNPFDALWSVPDIGPVYGHEGFYTGGYIGGMVVGIAAQSMIGNVAGGCLAASKPLQLLAKAYNFADNAMGVYAASQAAANILTGNGTWQDGLALTGFIPNKTGCFEEDTLVMRPRCDAGCGVSYAGLGGPGTPWNITRILVGAVAISYGLGHAGAGGRRRKKHEEEEQHRKAIERLFEGGDSDPLPLGKAIDELTVARVVAPASQWQPCMHELREEPAVGLLEADESYVDNEPRMVGHPRTTRRRRPTKPLRAAVEMPRTEPRSWRSSLVLAASLLLGCLCIWSARPTGPSGAELASVALASARSEPQSPFEFTKIQDIRIHQRVIGRNPEISDAERELFEDPDVENSRLITLVMQKPDGGRLDIQLSRDLGWIEEYGVEVGATIDLDLAELGAEGPAEVVAIEPAPPLEAGNDPVVTGTFKHTVRMLVDLHVDGLSEPIGVTSNHPFWSIDRQEFIPAGDLRVGERVHAQDHALTVLRAIARSATKPVYNLETDEEHVYCVCEAGILVHNTCGEKRKYLTYIADDLDNPGKKYIGRTSGFGSVDDILAKRASNHHRNLGPLKLDRVSSSRRAIRGREHIVFESLRRRGVGTDQIRPISGRNGNIDDYLSAAKRYLRP